MLRKAAYAALDRRSLAAILEPMESRVMLSADPVITEFMADNKQTLKDRFGEYSDWIEIYNPNSSPVDLQGWYLTDTTKNLREWQFPSTVIPANGYLTVFASGEDVRVSGQELHTNFQLASDGDFLALVKPDGMTIASQYSSKYPKQFPDISYGLATESSTWTLLPSGAMARMTVPTGDMGLDWTQASYDDTTWTLYGPTAVGFDATTMAASPSGSLFYGKFGANGTYHLYEVVSNADTWMNAYNAAKAKSNSGVAGHLVTISSAAENAFVQSIIGGDSWTGLTDNSAFASLGAKDYGNTSSWPLPSDGQVPTAKQRGAGFVWSNGEAFTYQKWQSGQPNANGGQDFVRLAKSDGTWNDQAANLTCGYVIEYDVNVAEPPSQTVPLPYRFSVVEAHSPTGLNNITDALNFLSSGTGTIYNYSLPFINLIDPEIGGEGHFSNSTAFKGNTSGEDDNVAMRITGIIRIPAGGQWTFGVNSDDGFRLQIDGAQFTSVSGGGTTISGDSMTYAGGRGPADSLGVATLSAGEHRVELTYYQGGGGSEIEFFAAQGTKSGYDSSFKLVGDTANGGLALVGMKDYIATDIQSAMYNKNASAYLRIPFTVTDLSTIGQLTLRMKYDDGFIAYINGHEVARSDNAPSAAGWNSQATSEGSDSDALAFEDFDISTALSFLNSGGTNVLAIQALNASIDNPDLFICPELVASSKPVISDQARYFLTPTPGKANSNGTADLGPIITDVDRSIAAPTDTDDVVVTAAVHKAMASITSVTLHYRTNFDQEVAVSMYDDGLHGDGQAGDGVYGATIPQSASAAGQMLRYYVTADDSGSHQSRYPMIPAVDPDPTGTRKWPEYEGFMIPDPAVTSSMNIIYWFIQDPYAADTRGGTRGSLFYNGEFYDNVFFRSRGGSSTGGTKIDFNRGYYFRFDPNEARVSEINLNKQGTNTWSYAVDDAWIRPVLAFETFRDAGCPASIAFPLRIQQNGAYSGLRIFIENVDDEYLERQGLYGDGALYKTPNADNGYISDADYFVKKNRDDEDNSDLQAFLDGLHQSDPAAKAKFIYDNVDIPEVLDYLAATTLVEEMDCVQKNYYLYRDTKDANNPNGTNKWMILPWDQHLTFGKNAGFADYQATDPWTHPFFGDSEHPKVDGSYAWNYLIDAVLDVPEIKQMYLRRLRTLMDKLLQPSSTAYADRYYEARLDQLYTLLMGDAQFKAQVGDLKSAFDALKNQYLAVRRQHLYVDHSTNTSYPDFAGIPSAQPEHSTINFGAIDFNPASGNQDEEYIELKNPNSYAVDISGWKLDGGVDYTFAEGTVIPANGSIYVSPSPTAFLARTTGPRGGQGLLVTGPYKNHLSAWGESVRLVDASKTPVSMMSYTGTPSQAQQSLRITEVMYKPAAATETDAPDNDQFEFIELQNISDQPLNLKGVQFVSGVNFVFGDITLAPKQYTVVVKNRAAFESRYGVGTVNIAGEYGDFSLDNNGERIELQDAVGENILDFTYDASWQPATDGLGRSLVITDPTAAPSSWNNGSSWRPSSLANGSPGMADPDPSQGAPTVHIVHVEPETQVAAVDSIRIVFSKPVTGFDLGDLQLIGASGVNLLTGAQTLTSSDNITWVLGGLSSITSAASDYTLAVYSVGSGIMDLAGNPLVAGDEEKFTVDPLVPTATITPVAPDPRNTGVSSMTITFSKPVMGLDLSDLKLTRDGNELLLTWAQSLTTTDNKTWTLSGLSSLTSATGTYVLSLDSDGSGITDLTGNKHLAGKASESFVVDQISPMADIVNVTPDPRNGAVGAITITFSEPVTGFDLADLSLTRNGGSNLLTAAQMLTTADNIHWVLSNLAGLTGASGSYVLSLASRGTGIVDLAGNPIGSGASDSFVVNGDTVPPTADIVDVTPDPRNGSIDTISIEFNEAVTGFDLSDLRLSRDGGENLLTAAQTVSSSDGKTWTLSNLAGLTGRLGTYVLTLNAVGSGIADAAGNALAADATEDFAVASITQAGAIRLQRSASDANRMEVYTGNGATPDYSVAFAALPQIHIVGLSGADQLTLDFSNGNMLPAGGLVFDGAGGSDSLKIKSSGDENLLVNNAGITVDATPITFANVEDVGWDVAAGSSLTIGGSMAVALDASMSLASLTLMESARLSLANGGDKVLRVGALSIGANATLDLGDNGMVISVKPETANSVLQQVTNWVAAARGGEGKWLGKGLTSNVAQARAAALEGYTGLGLMLNAENGEPIKTTFAGQAVGANDILVKYTWTGDLNLDATVDGDDYFIIDSNFISQLASPRYQDGDLNSDGVIDGDDYFLMDSAFIAQGPRLAAEETPVLPSAEDVLVLKAATTPEPQTTSSVLQQLFSVKPVL